MQSHPSPLISIARWGYLALSALIFALFADMLFIWPFGSMLGAGQWVHVGQGKKAGWQFHFDSGLQWLNSLFLWATAALYVLASVHASRLKARYQKPRNPRCQTIPSVNSVLALGSALARGEKEVLVEFESPREKAVRTQAASLLGGLFLWLIGLQLGNQLAGWLTLAKMSSARFFLLGVCLLPGLDFVLRGLRSMRRALEIDERLLFQFTRKEIGLIDCQVTRHTEPQRVLSFEEIHEVQLLSIRDNKETLRALKVVLHSGAGEPLQVGSDLSVAEEGLALEAAQRLADSLGKPLVRK